MNKEVPIPRPENKARSQLKRILPELVLPMTGSLGAGTRLAVVAAKEVEQIPRLQLSRFVRSPVGVNQQWEGNAGLFAKQARIIHVAQPDRGQRGASLFEFALVLAQLRDMLAAEDSSVMAQKDHNRRTVLPQRTESHFAPSGLRQDKVRQLCAEGFRHDAHCIGQDS